VPATVGLCPDRSVLDVPFYVVDRLDGRTLRTRQDTGTLTEAQRAGVTGSLLDTLVALHDVDPASVGLADWGRPDGYLERQVRRWSRQWEHVATVARPEFGELVQRLTQALPRTSFPGIVHGDYKIDNVMVDHADPTRIVGVLDWEMATLGDTLADVGLLVSFWDEEGSFHNPITAGATALPGFPGRADVVEAYATRRGIGFDDLDWYIVLADLKVAVVLEQIHARHLQGLTVGDGFDDIGDMVGPLLQRALDRPL
jgi:aminoglycoside phosphotransferase (APT) family kinase protein